MRRMWELTYRVSAGSLKYATGSVRTASEPIVSKDFAGVLREDWPNVYLHQTYRISHLVWDLGWVDFDLDVSPCCLPSQQILQSKHKRTKTSLMQQLSFQVNQLHKHLHPGHVRIRVSIIRDESFLDRDDFERNDDLTAIDRRIIVSVTRPVVAKATAVYETTANIVGYPKRLIAQVKVRIVIGNQRRRKQGRTTEVSSLISCNGVLKPQQDRGASQAQRSCCSLRSLTAKFHKYASQLINELSSVLQWALCPPSNRYLMDTLATSS